MRVNIWKDGEYDYAAAYGFVPNIRTYLHDDEKIRPAMIVVPGGGYCMVVNSEGEPVVDEFYKRGMNVFVLTYTTDITTSVPLKMQPMNDISRAIRLIRSRAMEFKINENKVGICGFSAGGHLCASISNHYEDVKDVDPKLDEISNRPDIVVLSYPVITSGKFTHEYSIISLLGFDADPKDKEYFSLEKQVTSKTPPTFVWQTVTDDLVPVENSLLYAEALRENGVPYCYYSFPNGRHGLSAANQRFKDGDMGEPYTFEQLDRAVKAVREGTAVNLTKERYEQLIQQFGATPEEAPQMDNLDPMIVYDDVAMWPELCAKWIKEIWGNEEN